MEKAGLELLGLCLGRAVVRYFVLGDFDDNDCFASFAAAFIGFDYFRQSSGFWAACGAHKQAHWDR